MRISGHCIKCGVWRESLHKDHIIPRALGGSNEASNIQLLCANCHQDKTAEDRKKIHWTLSAKTRKRQSKGQLRRYAEKPMAEATKQKLSLVCGRPQSEEVNKRRSQKLKGRKLSPEHREKIRRAMLGRTCMPGSWKKIPAVI